MATRVTARVTSANNHFDAIKKNSLLFGAQFSKNNRFPSTLFHFLRDSPWRRYRGTYVRFLIRDALRKNSDV